MTAAKLAKEREGIWLQVQIGMPQLAPSGLSEAWLIKSCGHQHWIAVAARLGLQTPDFRSADGARLYAAFTIVRVSSAQLSEVREHQTLEIETSVERLSRTQFQSRHVLTVEGACRGVVDMISLFVRRTEAGVNRSIERSMPAGAPCLVQTGKNDDLVSLQRSFRKVQWTEAHGIWRKDRQLLETLRIDPCPHSDFNGVDFLYFASFQAFCDRAEWVWFGMPSVRAATIQRDIFYYGNVEIGEAVELSLCAATIEGKRLVHWIEMREASTGRRIADVISVRDGLGAGSYADSTHAALTG